MEVLSESERIKKLNLEWLPLMKDDKPQWGMVCKDKNGCYYIIGDAIEGAERWAHDEGCGCCSQSFGPYKADVMLYEYAWLVPKT